MKLSRLFPHAIAWAPMRRYFTPAVVESIQRAVTEGEQRHAGQIRFAAEAALPASDVVRGITPRQRAEQVFAQLRVWDTHANSGVLIYVLYADRAIEIVADRGIAAKVAQSEWTSICERMRQRFAAREFERGSLEGVAAVSDLLAAHFPPEAGQRNELPDRPVLL